MYRGLSVLRGVLLGYALYWNLGPRWYRYEDGHPTAAVLALLLLAAWTAATAWLYDRPRLRTTGLLLADLAVCLAAMSVTPWLQGGDPVTATLPSFWVFGVVVAWAVRWHVAGGLVAAVLVAGTDLLLKVGSDAPGSPSPTTIQSWMLLFIGGGVVGFMTAQLQRMAAARDLAERRTAAVEERARLARAVHDGTLQVLSLVHRRGQEAGGDLAELGRLAGNQEASLRALLQDDSPLEVPGANGQQPVDLAARLAGFSSPTVSVSGPGKPVPLPGQVVAEVAAAVAECLSNVSRHAGPEVAVWILVEDLGPSVVVSVRDDGPGFEPGRLEQARREGRLGVQESICGRLKALGGTAEVHASPGQGVEWELEVPR